jgi:hypothetical protein
MRYLPQSIPMYDHNNFIFNHIKFLFLYDLYNLEQVSMQNTKLNYFLQI